MPADKAEQFVKEIEEIDGWPAFVIGSVVEGTFECSKYLRFLLE